jgi:hypothetical protein
VGAFRPGWGQKVAGNIGLGVGTARARFDFTGYLSITKYTLDPVTQVYTTYQTIKSTQLDYKDTKTFFSGFAFAEMSIRLCQNLYFGISGDYVLKHTEEIPAFEDFGIPARKVRLGNASVGFTMGWHF